MSHHLAADERPQILVVVENRGRRDEAPRQQPPRTVQVRHDRIQQLSSLHQTDLEPRPLAVIKDQRQGVKPPRLWLHQAGRRPRRETMAVRLVCD